VENADEFEDTEEIKALKLLIDGMVSSSTSTTAKRIEDLSLADIPNNIALRDILTPMTDKERKVIADLVNESIRGGIFKALNELASYTITTMDGIRIPNIAFHMFLWELFLHREAGYEWPDED
jgi:hypothetical protein